MKNLRWWIPPLLILIAVSAQAVIPEVAAQRAPERVAERLADPEYSGAALDELVDRRDVALLTELARNDAADVPARGWAVVGLARIGDPASVAALDALQAAGQPALVRTWAAAARISQARDLSELRTLAPLRNTFPALDRPLRLQVEALMADARLEDLLALSQDPTLASAVTPVILDSASEGELVRLMMRHRDDPVRRQAAAFAATRATRDGDASEVPDLVLQRLALRRGSAGVPWEGGALYVPGIQWGKRDGRRLVKRLMGWWLILDSREAAEKQQVWNNLYSYSLLTGAGYDMSLQATPEGLLAAITRAEGRGAAQELLSRIGLANDPRYREGLR